jgi:hypothetical protein
MPNYYINGQLYVPDPGSYLHNFAKEWLFEMPTHTGKSPTDLYSMLLETIKNEVASGNKPQLIGLNFFKMPVTTEFIYYWIEDNHVPVIIVEL